MSLNSISATARLHLQQVKPLSCFSLFWNNIMASELINDSMNMKSGATAKIVICGLLAYGILSFFAVAIFGFGKDPSGWMVDFGWYYAGGECILSGQDMYDVACVAPKMKSLFDIDAHSGVLYPPNFSIIAAFFALFDWVNSAYLFQFIFSATAICVVYVLVKAVGDLQGDASFSKGMNYAIATALVFGSSGLWASIWLGQVTVLLAAAIWLAFRNLENGEDVVAGILLGFVSIKPQICVLLFLWLLLNGKFKVLVSAAITALIMASYAFFKMGFVPPIAGWLHNLSLHQGYGVNTFGSDQVMGLPSLLALAGLHTTLTISLIIGALLIAVLKFRSKVPPFSIMALSAILLIQMSIFSHPYDTILIAPVFAAIWPSKVSNWQHILLFAIAAAVFCFPQQLVVKAIPFDGAGHFRSLLIVPLAFLYFKWCLSGVTRFEFRNAVAAAR